MTPRTERLIMAIVIALTSAVTAAGAYVVAGWLGVGIIGLLIAFVAFQTQLDSAAPIGGQQNAELYAASLADQDRTSRADKAARRAESSATLANVTIAKIVGAALALIGLCGFFLVQLPH